MGDSELLGASQEAEENEDVYLELLQNEIILLVFERTAKDSSLPLSIVESLLFLMTPLDLEELIVGSDENDFMNLLGLSQEDLEEVNRVNFSTSEVRKLKILFFQEFNKVIKEIFDIVATFGPGAFTIEVPQKIQDLQKLVLDVNSEVENLVQSQNEFINKKYKIMLTKLMDRINECKEEFSKTLKFASVRCEESLKQIYPSPEYYDEMIQAASNLEEELSKCSNDLEMLKATKENYSKLDQQELRSLVSQYKQIIDDINLKELTLNEVLEIK